MGIAIDNDWNCVINVTYFVLSGIVIIGSAIAITWGTDGVVIFAVIWLLSWFAYSTFGVYGVATACGW